MCEHFDIEDDDCKFWPNLERCPYGYYKSKKKRVRKKKKEI